jgi:hypothetical protein
MPVRCTPLPTGRFQDDGNRIVGRWELAADCTNYETDFDLIYRRVKYATAQPSNADRDDSREHQLSRRAGPQFRIPLLPCAGCLRESRSV